MITINPIKLIKSKPISFGEGNLNNITSEVAILSLQNPNAKVNFENDLNRTQKADMVQNRNIFSAFAYKAAKAFETLKASSDRFKPDCVEKHIIYMA